MLPVEKAYEICKLDAEKIWNHVIKWSIKRGNEFSVFSTIDIIVILFIIGFVGYLFRRLNLFIVITEHVRGI